MNKEILLQQLAQIHRQTKEDHIREFQLKSDKKMVNRTNTNSGAQGGGRGQGKTSFIDKQFEEEQEANKGMDLEMV